MNINNNIEESYCSREVCILLKEKGFSIYQSTQYSNTINPNTVYCYTEKQCKLFRDTYYRPTQAFAIEWMRVNFGKHILIAPTYFNDEVKGYIWNNHLITMDNIGEVLKRGQFDTPQEAIEAALLYTLTNLIK